jgi:hypothetical protein
MPAHLLENVADQALELVLVELRGKGAGSSEEGRS